MVIYFKYLKQLAVSFILLLNLVSCTFFTPIENLPCPCADTYICCKEIDMCTESDDKCAKLIETTLGKSTIQSQNFEDSGQVDAKDAGHITAEFENENDFITTWEFPLNQNTITLYFGGNEEITNYNIDWGDGSKVERNQRGTIVHTYKNAGSYIMKISGSLSKPFFGYNYNLVAINQWGTIQWRSMANAFNHCENLHVLANDTPDLSLVTDMSYMFNGARLMDTDISEWDVSNVTNMEGLFENATSFNQPLNAWDVSKVTNMENMFYNAASFNQPIEQWDVSKVTNMKNLFAYATQFNQTINNWDTGALTSIRAMFLNAYQFNQPLNAWDVSNVTHFASAFEGARMFNQPLNNWDVSKAIHMYQMFDNATSFNQNINNWKVDNLESISEMFHNAFAYNQSIANWNISHVSYMKFTFDGIELSTDIYDEILAKWSLLELQKDLTLDANGSHYCHSSEQRQKLIDEFHWTINDLGLNCD